MNFFMETCYYMLQDTTINLEGKVVFYWGKGYTH